MKKFLKWLPLLLIPASVYAAGKLQNEDFKTKAQILAAGGTASQLLNDTKIWVTGSSDTLDQVLGSISSGVNQYCAVVAATPISGFSTQTTIGAAITACSAGGQILVTSGTYTENVTVSKQLSIVGVGYAAYLNGTLTFNSSSDKSIFTGLRIGGNITLNSGADGIALVQNWWSSGQTYSDSGAGNYVELIQE